MFDEIAERHLSGDWSKARIGKVVKGRPGIAAEKKKLLVTKGIDEFLVIPSRGARFFQDKRQSFQVSAARRKSADNGGNLERPSYSRFFCDTFLKDDSRGRFLCHRSSVTEEPSPAVILVFYAICQDE